MYTIKSYVFPESLEEADELLHRDVRNTVVLGGCCWLKMTRRRIRCALDLTRLGLDQIELRDGFLELGACVTLRELETNPLVTERFDGLLGKSVSQIVGVQFRNCATVGGSVFSRFGFSDLTCALLALDASVVLYRGGEIPLEQFLEMPIRSDDLLLKVRIRDDGRRAAYASLRRSATDFPVLAAAVSCLEGRWRVSVGARPARAALAREAARCLEEGRGPEAAGSAAARELHYSSNLRAGKEYREKLAAVLVRRAAQACMEGDNVQ